MKFVKNLVELRNVSVRFGNVPILSDINFTLGPRENWAIIGANGAGKTTFLRLIRGDIWPAPNSGVRTYLVNGKAQISPIGFRENTGIVSSDLLYQYRMNGWNPTAIETVCTGFEGTPFLYSKPTEPMLDRARQVLSILGLEKLSDQPILTMSLGQAKKVLIGRAIVREPKILFLDELVASLDSVSRKKVLEIVESLAAQGTQLIVAAHGPQEIPGCVTRIATLKSGTIVDSNIISRPDNQPLPHSAVPITFQSGGSLPEILEQSVKTPIIRIEDVDVSKGGKRVLRKINWRIYSGQTWALLGENGSGKTTLLKLIAGELPPVWGGIIRRFEPNDPQSVNEIRKFISLVTHDSRADCPADQKGLDIVVSGLYGSLGMSQKPAPEHISLGEALLKTFNMESLGKLAIGSMSYGQACMILILRALINSPRILLLDEPLLGLDLNSRTAVMSSIEKAVSMGVNIIYVTHDQREILPIVSHVAVLKDGMITGQTTPDSLFQTVAS